MDKGCWYCGGEVAIGTADEGSMDAKITLQKMSTPDTSGQRDNIYWRHVGALRFVMTTEDSLPGF
ncbi:MAG: hypothetical protein ABSD38_36250 [Syntrophorhabdales bacterium]|jgi:hypothetical protein